MRVTKKHIERLTREVALKLDLPYSKNVWPLEPGTLILDYYNPGDVARCYEVRQVNPSGSGAGEFYVFSGGRRTGREMYAFLRGVLSGMELEVDDQGRVRGSF